MPSVEQLEVFVSEHRLHYSQLELNYSNWDISIKCHGESATMQIYVNCLLTQIITYALVLRYCQRQSYNVIGYIICTHTTALQFPVREI